MEFIDLRWRDFKSFLGEHYLDFQQYPPGLYFLRGENRAEPELGSNGAAKSSILDVIHWCLFGTSMRGIRTPQLVPWRAASNMPQASLRVRIGDVITISRTYRPTRITVVCRGEEASVTQEQLEDIIGLTSDTFQSSILIGQFTRMFFDLKPREKMLVFAELLDLDYWIRCAENATNTLNILRDDEYKHQQKLDRSSTIITEIERNVTGLKKELSANRRVIKKERRKIKHERDELLSELDDLKRSASEMAHKKRAAESKLKSIDLELSNIETRVSSTREKLSDLSASIQVKKGRDADLIERERRLKEATGRCPTCGQVISIDHRRAELSRLTQLRKDVAGKILALEEEVGKLDLVLIRRKNLSTKRADKSGRMRNIISQLTLDMDKCDYRCRAVTKEVGKCNEQLEALRKQKHHDSSNLKKQERRLSRVKKSRKRHHHAIREIWKTMEQTRYWIQGFKEIRLYELGEVIKSLEVEINSYLADLGMEQWTVYLQVERETKSGSISKGFQVMVDPGIDSESTAKPWEAWSGGEGQRLRLAGTLALSNLILKQFNHKSNIQVWDEKLIWMSGTGEDDMLSLLREIAIREDKQIWVIDQHNLDYVFDGTLTVFKDKDGSRLVT